MTTIASIMKSIYASLLLSSSLFAAESPDLQSLLQQGEFQQAIKVHTQTPSNQSTFTKAICQLTTSIEALQQGFYKYGFELNSSTAGMQSLAPIPHNPNPEIVDYQKIRTLIERFHADLHAIEKTLATVGEDEFHLPLDLTKVRFDIDKNGERTEMESSIALFLNIQSNGRRMTQQQIDEMKKIDGTIGFDKSDIIWLKGYIQVSLGVSDLLLAHDFEQAFNAISSNLFQKPKNALSSIGADDENYGDIANLIAAVHLAKMKVIEPDRLKQARQHLLNMVDCSKQMWVSILAETDNNKEWLPSPKQKSVTGVEITDAMVKDWHKFLTEYEAILNGDKLVPHWRFKNKGINLKRVLEESVETDIVLWVTGHAVEPYLEKGELTDDGLWRQLNQTFNGNFLGMSFFIN
jgi:CRISPR/Cas system-associated exonuclease Cas4 (RecB family)